MHRMEQNYLGHFTVNTTPPSVYTKPYHQGSNFQPLQSLYILKTIAVFRAEIVLRESLRSCNTWQQLAYLLSSVVCDHFRAFGY